MSMWVSNPSADSIARVQGATVRGTHSTSSDKVGSLAARRRLTTGVPGPSAGVTEDSSGVLGTTVYISPEIAHGWAEYDEKAPPSLPWLLVPCSANAEENTAGLLECFIYATSIC